ncbi:MAG: 30S ribosomal protein S6 [Oligoflexia bacterium]|nr:30S ribosomal protein S6 [Oligoflexia bacterium]
MIYEAAVLAHADLNDEKLADVKAVITSVIQDHKGEIYLSDDWGVRTFAQPTERHHKRGRYLYFLYTANNMANAELDRRLRINDGVIRSMIIKADSNKTKDDMIKNYKSPFSNN